MAERTFSLLCHPYNSKKENGMTSNVSLRRTEILVASLWLVTAIGAIAGAFLINPVINAPDYLTTIFPKSATVVTGMLLWLVGLNVAKRSIRRMHPASNFQQI